MQSFGRVVSLRGHACVQGVEWNTQLLPLLGGRSGAAAACGLLPAFCLLCGAGQEELLWRKKQKRRGASQEEPEDIWGVLVCLWGISAALRGGLQAPRVPRASVAAGLSAACGISVLASRAQDMQMGCCCCMVFSGRNNAGAGPRAACLLSLPAVPATHVYRHDQPCVPELLYDQSRGICQGSALLWPGALLCPSAAQSTPHLLLTACLLLSCCPHTAVGQQLLMSPADASFAVRLWQVPWNNMTLFGQERQGSCGVCCESPRVLRMKFQDDLLLKILWLKCCLRFPSEPAALIMRSWWEGQANFGSKWDKSGFNRNLVTLLKITSSVGGQHLQLVDWQPAEAFVWAIIQAKVNFINPLFKQLVWSHRLVPVLENVRDTFWLDTRCTGKCRIISDMQAVFQPAELKIPWNGEHSERMLFAFADSSTEPNLLIFLEQITSPTQSVCLLGVLEESLLQSLSAPDICSHSYLN